MEPVRVQRLSTEGTRVYGTVPEAPRQIFCASQLRCGLAYIRDEKPPAGLVKQAGGRCCQAASDTWAAAAACASVRPGSCACSDAKESRSAACRCERGCSRRSTTACRLRSDCSTASIWSKACSRGAGTGPQQRARGLSNAHGVLKPLVPSPGRTSFLTGFLGNLPISVQPHRRSLVLGSLWR